MAAALFRRGTGLCVKCFHRELCRVLWRPQAALFSSKPPDRKPPRRTHIRKAKPQPAVDVAKLLEQLFSQRRPSTAPPAASKAQPAKASVMPPTTTSSGKVSTSNVPHLSKTEPAVSVFPAAASVSKKTAPTSNTAPRSSQPKSASSTNPNTLFSSETPQQFPLGIIQDITSDGVSSVTVPTTSSSTSTRPASSGSEAATVEHQTKVEAATEADELTAPPVRPLSAHTAEKNVKKPSVPAATGEPFTETGPSVEASLPPAGPTETRASVAEAPVDTAAQKVQIKSSDSGVVDVSFTTTVEASTEATEQSTDTSITALETLDSIAAAAEGTVEPTIESEERVVNMSYGAKEALIETTVKSPTEVSLPFADALENRASVEGPVASRVDASTEEVQAKSLDLGVVKTLHTTTVEPLLETTIDPSGEGSPSLVDTLEMSVTNSAVEATIDAKADTTPQVVQTNSTNAHESEVESATESIVESSSGNVTVEKAANESEQMTLESVTLHSVKSLVESLKTDELLQTKFIIDEKAEKQLQELLLVQTEVGAERKAGAEAENPSEDESEVLTKALSKWDSLSEDLQELEGETGSLVKELLCHVPAALPTTPGVVKTSSASDQPVGGNGGSLWVEEKASEEEAMTLESVTLAEVKAEVGGLETEILQETSNALEKEAGGLAKEEKMEVKATVEDVVFEDTTEVEILTLDSISEATDAIEAEASIMLEAMFGSEQGPRQPPDILIRQNEMIGQEAEKESGEQEGSVLEAMSLESVTLAEVEASLGTLENESLSETMAYLENEAEILAGGRKMEVEELTESRDMIEDLNVESLSLPEADDLSEDLQSDALMEELLFTVPGHVAGVTEARIGQEAVRANILDATVVTGSVGVDTAAAETGDFPASHSPKEVLLGQEMLEEGAQTEALGNEEDTGTKTDLDPVQRLFLEKIREYNSMRRLSEGPVEAGPDYDRYLSEETAKLQRLYGGGDLSSFPQFTFTEPEMDQDCK
ncbi:uro-adherence factor A-like [Trachinotus anak]|uniref:uro-adherence factor A-like n=1 Tax=Trachinotus anak TaxID=443729 RepID=UPI0039F22DC8